MSLEITIPSPGESITEVTLGTWLKQDGDWVEQDEMLCEIESDKATLELPSPAAGVLARSASEGEDLPVGAVIGTIDTSAERPAGGGESAGAATASADGGSDSSSSTTATEPTTASASGSTTDGDGPRATTMAKKLAAERGVNLTGVSGSGPAGRIMKADVLTASDAPAAASSPAPAPASNGTAPAPAPAPSGTRGVRRERMTKLRQRIAERLVEAQHEAAMLTTFNECDMTAVMAMRAKHKEAFAERHGVNLGFMSFFVKACVSALRAYPRVNAYIVDSEVEFHDYCDVAVAVGTPKGLVVPVVRNAEALSFAGVESTIKDLAIRARDGKLGVDEMTGGTFTVSNGGVYGSLMSTPILNPPQSAILGMHKIMKRAVEHPDKPGELALRPMMYLALSYDHRIIDGAEAVGFLVHIKECIEDPARLLLD